MSSFADREEAGHKLAKRLAAEGIGSDAIVLGLPRGGVPVAAPVAEELGVPLDVLVVRKLGMPGHSELAMGAVASGGVRVLNEEIVGSFGIDPAVIEQVSERELAELERRERLYRGDKPDLEVAGLTAVVVDDGLATGASMRVAIESLRRLEAKSVVVAVPVAAPDVCRAITAIADRAVCLETPEPFVAVGRWYRHFPQVSDEEVAELLARFDRSGRKP